MELFFIKNHQVTKQQTIKSARNTATACRKTAENATFFYHQTVLPYL